MINWKVLKEALIGDHQNSRSDHDFGKNVIPMLLNQGKRLCAYTFSGYWQDVGTIDSYYHTNMELLNPQSQFNIFEEDMRIFSNSNIYPPHYIGRGAVVENSLICNGSRILGDVKNSILSFEVSIEAGASVSDSILLPGASVKKGAQVFRTIVGEHAIVGEDAICGNRKGHEITVIGDNQTVFKQQEGGSHE